MINKQIQWPNFPRIHRNSIRKEINRSYLNIYLLIALLVLISSTITCYIFIHFYFYSITKEDFKDIRTHIVQSGDGTVQFVYSLDPYQGREMLVLDPLTGIQGSLTTLSFDFIVPKNRVELLVQELKHNRVIITSYFNTGNRQIAAYVFYRLDNLMKQLLMITLLPLTAILAIGFGILWIAGTSRTRSLLKPIAQINQAAKKISAVNLDSRINVEDIHYELKDMAITLNGMLSRINDDYSRQKEFVSDVSHEMRTPIAVISGYVSMLNRWGKEDPEILKESIEAIMQETESMKALIENLLFLARSDNKTLVYQHDQIDLSELVLNTIKETEMIDSFHNFESLINEKVMIYGDLARIKQALRIVFDNAIKYTPSGGNIRIQVKTEENFSFFAITDSGMGIEESDLPRIFERFYRSDKSRNKKTGGNGLGLAICRTIIRDHDGKIIVRSKVGVGTEIRFVFPNKVD